MNMNITLQPRHNYLLAALSPEVQSRLFPQLQLVPLCAGTILCESNAPVQHVYFPVDSIVSHQYLLQNGLSIATSLVGREGLVGITSLLCEERTVSRSVVVSAGSAYRISRLRMKEEMDRNDQFFRLVLRFSQSLLTQVSQTALCNRHHSVEQQFCCWLLNSIDRLPHNRLQMTQEFIGNLLGVRRESITEAAKTLQQLGGITYSRGSITVLDRQKVESLACECYRASKTEGDVLLDYTAPFRLAGNMDPIPTTLHALCSVKPLKLKTDINRRSQYASEVAS